MKAALPAQFRGAWTARIPKGIEPVWYDGAGDAPAALADAEIAWLGYGGRDAAAKFIAAAPKLRWLSTHAAGVETFPHAELARRGIVFTTGAGISAVPVAEFALLGMLALLKDFPAYVRAQDRGEWLSTPPAHDELAGSSALIVGYGGLGRALGERLRAFGVSVTGVRRHPGGEPGVIAADAWRECIGDFDWIVLTAPLTAATRAVIGVRELAHMKATARLVNMARGGLVNEAALVEALHARRIAGAYLDVTDPEPAPPGAPIWTAPNVILSAHLSGSATTRLAERAGALFAENLERYASNRPLLNVLTRDAE